MKITKDTLIVDLLQLDRDVSGLLMGYGMHCLGCMLANNETIGQACMAHGIDADTLIDDINRHLQAADGEALDD